MPYKYFWLSVEGTDAVGKTTLVKKIEAFLKRQKKIKFAILKEFSNSKVGNLIKQIIDKERFFRLGKVHYPFSETLLLYTDFIYQFEQILLKYSEKDKLFIVSDRGPYSFFTYQFLRIKDIYNIQYPNYLKDWLRDIFLPLGMPNLTILLISPLQDIKKRIEKREGSITKKDLLFIDRVQKEYLKISERISYPPILVLENRNGNFSNIEKKTIKIIKEILKKF
jgi:thymidylate kinase